MDIQNISSQLKFANRIGQTLSTQQIIGLQASILKLSHQYKFQKFMFWGRVEGTIKNYYVVYGINFRGTTNFPHKKYFWSSQEFIFAELPAQRSEFVSQVVKISDFFSGQHEKIVIKGESKNVKNLSINGQDFVVKSKNFTELDRLSVAVNQIDQECQVVPLGAYKMIPTHQLILNPSFRGLKINEASQLKNYAHLRQPQHKQQKIIIECDKALERNDFLDSLDQDSIKESWSIQTDESKTEVTIRSMVWPGYLGYHRANSNRFGGVYLGTGLKNYDLPFII